MKRLFLTTLLFLALPLTAAASTQVMGGAIIGVGASTYTLVGAALSNGGKTTGLMPVGGTINNLQVWVSAAPTTGTSETFTLKKDSTNQSVTCTIGVGVTTCSDTVDSFSFVAGDAVSIVVTKSGTPPGATGGWSVVFTPTNANDTIITSFSNANDGQATQTYRPFGDSGDIGTEATTENVFPEAGTLDTLNASSTTLSQGTYRSTFMQNAASSSPLLNCTITTSVKGCTDNSDVDTIAQGDRGSFAITPQGTPTNSSAGIAARFVPTTPGDFDLQAFSGSGTDTVGATRYMAIAGGGSSAIVATEASTSIPMAESFYITSLFVRRGAAAGTGHTATITVNDNSTGTSATCQISGASATTCSFSGSVLVNAGDLLDIQIALSSSGTNSTYKIGVVGNTANPTPPSAPPSLGGFWLWFQQLLSSL